MGQFELDLSGQTIDGRFRIECRIGSGGMGSVWRAQHVQTLQYFALKTLRVFDDMPDGAIQRCLKEARAAAALRSRHVVRITDVQPDYRLETTPLPYLVMELLEGIDFESVLARRKRLTTGEVSWVLTQLCRGIQTAHDGGIVHRDLKPANLFLATDDDGSSVVKICDFGLAKLAPVASNSDGLTTETGVIVGTPRYMAPEQLRGAKRIGTTADQWAIGLIAYRMLAGDDYFDGTANPVELTLRIVHDELPAPSRCSSHVPRGFDDWFFQSCARVPERRFRSVQEQAQMLVAILGDPIPIGLNEFRQVGGVPRHASQRESIGATMASETSQSSRAARNLYVALGISASIGVIGTTVVGALQPFRLPAAIADEAPSTSTAVTVSQQPMPHSSSMGASTVDLASSLAAGEASVDSRPTDRIDDRRQPARGQRRPSIMTAMSISSIQPPTTPSANRNQGLQSGMLCVHSSECLSRLCLAERCR
jgi:eukaryotic-like serine/threonine-protein kinase